MATCDESNNRMLNVLARKLGLNDDAVLRKAAEISRLIDLKTASFSNKQRQLSASTQNVISLDLAASMKGASIDKNQAIKLSGVSKRDYLQKIYSMERLLDLQPPGSVRDMCIRLGCSELSSAAERLLARHKEEDPYADKEHPMFAAGAIFAVAKQHKLTVDKAKLQELGRARPRQLEEVKTLMTATLSKMGGMKKPGMKQQRGRALLDILSKADNESLEKKKNERKVTETTEEEEDFETWKQRMLDEAEAELKQAENKTETIA